jgi:delta8-fatty-acid desaturase
VEGEFPSLGGIAEAGGVSAETVGTPEIAKDFHELNRRIRRAGLYETRDSFYLGKYGLLAGLFAAAWVLAPGAPVVAGILFGLFVQQAAFIGHDLGHNSVMTRDRGLLFNRKYKRAGTWVIANLCFGTDGLNWSRYHETHHKLNLRYARDPQNNHMPWILYEAGEYDYYTGEGGRVTPFHRFWMRHQHLFVLPLMLAYGKINMLVKAKKLYRRRQYFRFFGIVLHVAIWTALIVRTDYSFGFFAVALVTCGVLHIQILLSHAYMPRFTEAEQHRLGWIRYQVLGTQNVETSWYDDWFHGGLQYQIEHHLYPGVPRHNLRTIRPWVMAFCEKHGLPYRSDPFLVCITDMVSSLYREARNVEARHPEATPVEVRA